MTAALVDLASMEAIDLAQAIRRFNDNPPSNAYEWQGAADRLFERFPNHPLTLAIRTLGEAWLPSGEPQRFNGFATQTFIALRTLEVDEEDVAAFLAWMLVQLRNRDNGRRWPWAALLWQVWDATGWDPAALVDLENQVLANARHTSDKKFDPGELRAVHARRVRRLTSDFERVADLHEIGGSDAR